MFGVEVPKHNIMMLVEPVHVQVLFPDLLHHFIGKNFSGREVGDVG